MSTITDAIQKRKKEVGEEEVKQMIPLSLDEPEVEVPKDTSGRRIAALAVILLLAGCVAVGAVMLYKEWRGGGSEAGRTAAKLTSLPGREVGELSSGGERVEAVPLPEPIAESDKTAVKIPTEALPAPTTARTREHDTPPEAATESPAAKVASSPPVTVEGSSETPEVTPEAPLAVTPDPFEGITLQGIVRFDPAAPEALINGNALKVGQSIKGVVVVEIGAESVKLRYGNVEKIISY